jgi:hypothetical protein
MKAQIKIDLAAHLQQVATRTYTDSQAYLTELIQNSQRSKAQNVFIETTDNSVTITDDGIGCKDYNDLLTLAHSGWTDVYDPFGQGFWSVLGAAQKIIVRSCDWQLTVNVPEILAGNLDLHAEKVDPISGFSVELYDTDPYILSKAEDLARFINLDIYYNGVLLEKEDFDASNDEWAQSIKNDSYHGYIVPGHGSIMLYYQGREVCDLPYCYGCGGRLEIADGILTLRAPDRKDVKRDEKLDNFTESILPYIEQMYANIVVNADDTTIRYYDSLINKFVPVEKLADLVSFNLIEGSNIAAVQEAVKNANNPIVQNAAVVNIEKSEIPSCDGNSVTIMDMQPIRRGRGRPRKSNTGINAAKLPKKVFWLNIDDVSSKRELLDKVQNYGMSIVIAKNRIEENVLRFRNIPHISALNDSVKINHTVTESGAISSIEERAIAAMNKIADMLDCPCIVNVGNIKSTEQIIHDGEVIAEFGLPVEALASYNGQIVINRKFIKHLKGCKKGTGGFDVKAFILLNLDVFAHELAHVKYGTDDFTTLHFTCQIKLMQDIADLLVSYKFRVNS